MRHVQGKLAAHLFDYALEGAMREGLYSVPHSILVYCGKYKKHCVIFVAK